MREADPPGLTRAEEAHRVDVHQTQFRQVQNNTCSAGADLSLQFLHMLRLHSANQSDPRAMLVRHRLDSEGHPCGGVQRRRQSKVVELLDLCDRWRAAFSAFADSSAWDHLVAPSGRVRTS